MNRFVISLLAIGLACVAPVSAQTRSQRTAKRVAAAPVAAPAPAPAPPVDVQRVFAITTGDESWALEDPMPTTGIEIGGKKLSIEERLVNASYSKSGERQLLFPISWFPTYADRNPELKYVIVRYRDGKACQIVAEYQPQRLALPRDKFEAYPDGKSFYSDVQVTRQNGRVYLKQAVSQGQDDGKGGLWVDTVVIYCVDDTTASAR